MAIAKNPKVLMTESEFIRRLQVLEGRKTFYKNKYPYNLCYINKDTRTSADCVNLIKAILNGYDVNNNTIGYYQRDLSNTGDCTEAELLCQCTDVSSDFRRLGGECAILYMKGHVGVYLGRDIVSGGRAYNTIECTASWEKGILYSYVDIDGTRRHYKGAVKNGKWTQYGRPTKWVGMNTVEPKPETPKVDYSKWPVLKRGSKGDYVKKLQIRLTEKGYNPKGIDGIFGPGCDAAVRGFQRENTDVDGKKLVVDGCVGTKTWGALYK